MSAIKLSDLQKAADEKYAPFTIEIDNGQKNPPVASFLPVLRLSKEDRAKVAAALDIQNRIKDEPDLDLVDVLSEAMRIAAVTAKDFDLLNKALKGDAALWAHVFETYSVVTALGEASPSES